MNTKALAVAASLWVPMVASAATEGTVTDRQEALSAQLEEILAKTGISIGGAFRGEVGSSKLGGNYAYAERRDDETIGFTSVDFDLRARPNTATTARAVFRMHLDHANFFGSPYSPLATRWLSIDGGFFDMVYYHFGNMQAKWSPLMIGATEPGFLYTPRIFAQQQKQAMDERFIGGGVRNLQGMNLGLRAAVPQLAIDSFDVSVLAAKLLSAATIADPYSMFVSRANLGGDALTGAPDSLANFDRWALGARGNVTFLKGVTLGASALNIKDLRSTYGAMGPTSQVMKYRYFQEDTVIAGVPSLKRAMDSTEVVGETPPEVLRDSIIQNGLVIGGVVGIDVARLLGNDNLIAGLNVDLGRSSWDRFLARGMDVAGTKVDSVSAAGGRLRRRFWVDTGSFKPIYETVNGLAVNATLAGGWKAEGWTAKVRAGYILTDSAFRSDLAQSPVFYSSLGRVFNTDQDSVGRLGKYNTFDAMYHQVHRFVAEDKNEYAKSPYDKIAYSNYAAGSVNPALTDWLLGIKSVAKTKANNQRVVDSMTAILASGSATRADSTRLTTEKKALITSNQNLYMASLEGTVWDRDIQLVLPVGEASANRVGPKFGLDFDLMQGGLEVKVDGYMLQEAKGTILDSANQLVAEKAKFQQVQAGLRTRIDRFITGWDKPIELSGSVGLSTAKGGTALNYQSTVINAGLYAGVIKRLAVLGGYQLIDGKDKAFFVDRKQSNMAGGLEFKVQEGAYLLGMYNLVKTEFPNAPEYNFDQTIWSTKISVSF
ncbi:MAG TPA: hypothetical protein PK208_14240 [Fibrobacteria bacterium]|nr:hypothetical protein [Fibrobacteria bacterium]